MTGKMLWSYKYRGEGGMDAFLAAQGEGWLSRKVVPLFGQLLPYTLEVSIPRSKDSKLVISTIMFFGLYTLKEEFVCGTEFKQTLPNGNEYMTLATVESEDLKKGELSIQFRCRSIQDPIKDMTIAFAFHSKYATSTMTHPTGAEAINFFIKI